MINGRRKNIIDFMRIFCSSFEETWIPFTQGYFVSSFVEIGPVVLEKKIFKCWQLILLFPNYLPCGKGVVLHLNKLESNSPRNTLCQVWLKLAQWFWRKIFLNFINVFSLFRNYFPFEKGGALHLNKPKSPSSKNALCQVWL